METNCKICNCLTDYENGLCGPCFNLGFRGITEDGNLIMDTRAVLNYMREYPRSNMHVVVNFYDNIFKERKEKISA